MKKDVFSVQPPDQMTGRSDFLKQLLNSWHNELFENNIPDKIVYYYFSVNANHMFPVYFNIF